jgi:hypothetical protein
MIAAPTLFAFIELPPEPFDKERPVAQPGKRIEEHGVAEPFLE